MVIVCKDIEGSMIVIKAPSHLFGSSQLHGICYIYMYFKHVVCIL